LAVEVSREGDVAVLRVNDDGVDIPPLLVEEVFQMFAQVDSTVQREQGGLGIGLALARSIMALHDGRIRADGAGLGWAGLGWAGLGCGSAFSIALPVAHSEAPAVTAVVTPAAAADTAKGAAASACR
jgi:signal transduction histidine kinase